MQGRLVGGRYRLTETIGSGGMGRVWRAHDEVLHRAVAIKELTAALYVSDNDQAVLLARTRAEARAAARINHSAVVTVHDVLEHDGRPWIVMELVEGRSLADAVKERGRVEPAEAARVGLWVLRALRAAHTAGVLHRDVKPGNVLLADDGRVLLTDFGIAQIDGDTTITRTGEVVGSVDYLAPERVRGHDPGPASDLWALGATLYTAVEGTSPFRRTSPLSTMQAVVEEHPAEPRYAGALGPVITALLRKEPAVRPASDEAERLLAEVADGRLPQVTEVLVPPARQPRTGPARQETRAHSRPHPFEPAPAAVPTRRWRRMRTPALVVAVAAVVGGAGAVVVQQWDDGRSRDGASPSVTSSVTPGPSDSPSPRESVPDTWVRKDDPAGFSLSLPSDRWQREVFGVQGDLTQIDYTPDGGTHLVRIAVDTSPDFDDPYEHQLDLEEQLQRLAQYQRVTMEKNTYRDREGSLWEYTWTALETDPGDYAGPRRAVEEMYLSRDGVEYAIYMSGPAADWETTREQFDTLLLSWRPGNPA
ncbi:serine/threonine-protein kinase [Streptomyces chromofuscus]|uniref:non-specific serine/threonine protein kinase n=1 Tax=Streptomyces chromofuscus TaxID=42881 RepID=A0A7M2TGV3_STRCW|nr:serine/threonine-protein kinase [Streptomyces chromofuscus]QOV47712.1 serine/threonine protein kinase [Streptomyces chromofuscus]GGT26955.1 serine/threonine protein kinase [Streptomyces chromofuscus]